MRTIPFDYAVRNLGRSPRRLAALLIGNALVVMLVVAAAAFVEGMRSSLTIRHDSKNVILLGSGSEESLERSEIPASVPGILSASIPGIRTVHGEQFVSPEILSALILKLTPDDESEYRGVVRGFTPGAFLVHSRVQMLEGRVPQAGSNEILVGSLAAEKLGLPPERLAIGQSLWFDRSEWKVVGKFQARGTVMDAEVWIPLTDLLAETKRTTISCVVMTLADAEFEDVDAFTKTRVDLELSAIRETEYYAALLRFYRPVQAMIWITAILVGLSGVLGGLNTLYAAFASRARELGMLQSLGYSRAAIVLSLIQEALLAASVAVLIALLVAKLLIDGTAIPFSMGVFELTMNSVVLAAGTSVGLLLGLVGALPPAWKCLTMPIPESLKAV